METDRTKNAGGVGVTITEQQISDLRSDLGLSSAIFTDEEITRIWERLDGARTEALQYDAAKALMAEQMLNNANKLHDYTVAGDSNKVSQVWDHWNKTYQRYLPSLTRVLGSQVGVAIAGIRPVVRQDREKPNA
jgi:hypothetical protein